MPKENYRNPAEYYASHSLITDPKEYRHLLADIPSSVSEMVEILQGLFSSHLLGRTLRSHTYSAAKGTRAGKKCAEYSRGY